MEKQDDQLQVALFMAPSQAWMDKTFVAVDEARLVEKSWYQAGCSGACVGGGCKFVDDVLPSTTCFV